MRKVVSTQEVAHLWNGQHQTEARNPNDSLYFRGKTIYSYGHHFPIAKIEYTDKGRKVLFTERSYSNTTAKHINIVTSACRNTDKIFCANPEATAKDNFEYWIKKVDAIAVKLVKAKKPSIYLDDIKHYQNRATLYAEFMGVEIPATLKALFSIKDKTEYLKFSEEKAAIKIAEEKAAVKKFLKDYNAKLKLWEAGKLSSYNLGARSFYNAKVNDKLRYNTEANEIETTQGVKIPFEAAKMLYLSILNNTLKVNDKILYYTVDTITNKLIKIGCHNFDKKHLLSFGKKLYNI